jgi:hypothetical protein
LGSQQEVNYKTLFNPQNKHSTAKLEDFTFATALVLDMGYDTISLDPDASKICTINFPLGKDSRLPRGRAGSPYFFQNGANGILRVCTSLHK